MPAPLRAHAELDDLDLRLKQRLQVRMALASFPPILTVGISFHLLGQPDAAAINYVYCLLTALLLIGLRLRRNYLFFREAHPLVVMLCPWVLHMWMGGFVASGGILMWGMVSPSVALLFVGTRRALVWMAAFIVLAVLAVTRELVFPLPPTGVSSQALGGLIAFNAVGMAAFIFGGAWYFIDRLSEERARSEELLLNVLPGPIAARLKAGEELIADHAEEVTVMFADLVGFTPLAATMSAQDAVTLLNRIFRDIDGLAELHGVEKIKTIGDAYMAVAGLPAPRPDHAEAAAALALDTVRAVAAFNQAEGTQLSIRVGLHTGPVVAGVIGTHKFSYDLWGDTVNTASRMESHGLPGRVQISEHIRKALGPSFQIEDREPIQVKGKGQLQTAWLVGRIGGPPSRPLPEAGPLSRLPAPSA